MTTTGGTTLMTTDITKVISTTTQHVETATDPQTPFYTYIIVETIYLIVFTIVAFLMKRYKFLKTEDDTVTRHHRHHFDLVKKQQDELIARQKSHENFLIASRT